MKIHIETDRLILRDIEESDDEGIFALDSNPKVHQYLGNNPITTIDQAQEAIQYIRGQYERNGIGRWAVEEKATGEFVGWTGLKFEENLREFNYYDLGYRFRQEFWGKGIASETAALALKYGFETMGLEEIGGAADIRHVVSNHILQKVGLKFVDTFICDGDECNWYNLKKENY